MNRSSLAAVVTVASALSVFGTSTAFAQDTSTVGGSAGGSVNTTTTVDPNANTNTTTTTTVTKPAESTAPKATAEAEGASDHEAVVGRFAVGYFGASQVPIAGGLTGAPSTITAPFVGIRYWISDRLGLDLALGFRTQSGSTEAITGNTTTTTELPGVLALGVKAGVPLALAYGKHYTFTLIPEILLAGATRTVVGQGNPPPADISLTGSRIELGARAGAEIQFGFIGVPQLALQGSIGLNVARIATKASQDQPSGGTNSLANDNIEFGTTVQSDPWALFTNNISALYYF